MDYVQLQELIKTVAASGMKHFEYHTSAEHMVMDMPGEKEETQSCSMQDVQNTQNDLYAQRIQDLQNSSNVQRNASAITPAAESVQMKGKEAKKIQSPLVGRFYRAADPDSEPFIKVGDRVKKGQIIGIIEAMKLMNEIESDFDGIVSEILVGNEEAVEYGQTLVTIEIDE